MTDVPARRGAALITGAAARLGEAVAVKLAGLGFDICVHYNRSKAAAEETAERIRATGRRAALIQGDLSDWDAVSRLVPEATAALGPLCVLVNNASRFEADELQSMTRESWEAHLGANLTAPVQLAQAFAAQHEAGTDGLVLNLIDQRVWRPTPKFFSYTIAKMALWDATRTMAQALAPQGVRVNGVGPGPTLRNPRQSEDDWKRQNETTILKRGATPDDIANAVAYLVDARAVTGQMIAVDGGQHLAWETPDVLVNE
ncbi:MAG: SDR family oxidoreductase [Pseudomonadota bacterium]